MRISVKNMTIVIVVCSMLIILILIKPSVFGVFKNHLEKDARARQKISDTWEASISANEDLAAMIFFDETLDNHIFSIYIKRDGISFGYFFNYGGSSGAIMDGIQQFTYRDKGYALISMNKDKVSRVEVDNGVNISHIDINPERPFAVALPANCGSVNLYDMENNEIQITSRENCT